MYFVGIYARLSVDGGERKNESVETQIEIAKEYMRKQRDMIFYDCYTDLGRTGTDFKRRGFARLMEDVRLRRVNCVIVKDFSRFGRNYIETGNYLQKIFPFLGVRFVAVTDCFDSLRDRSDDIGVNLKNLANEMYARDIALKVSSVKRARWTAGSYTGGVAPYGYRGVKNPEGTKLLVETEAAEVVREMFALCAGGKSLKEIGNWLYDKEIHCPTEYRKCGHVRRQEGENLTEWSRMSIKTVLTNPVYMGCMVRPASKNGDYMLRGPEDMVSGKWLVKRDTHEALICENQFFQTVQRFKRGDSIRRVKAEMPEREKMLDKGIFDGILHCGVCGKRLGRRGYGMGCCGCSITGETLTGIVKAALSRELALADFAPDKLVRKNAGCFREQIAVLERERRKIQRRMKQGELACGERYLKYREGVVSREEFLDWKGRGVQEAADLQESLDRVNGRIDEREKEAARQGSFLESLFLYGGEWEPDKVMIEELVEDIRIYPDRRAEITFRFCAGGL